MSALQAASREGRKCPCRARKPRPHELFVLEIVEDQQDRLIEAPEHRVDHALRRHAAIGEPIEALDEHRAQSQQSVDYAIFGLRVEPPQDRIRVAVAPAVLAGNGRFADAAQTMHQRDRAVVAQCRVDGSKFLITPAEAGDGVKLRRIEDGQVARQRSQRTQRRKLRRQARRKQLVYPLRLGEVFEVIRADIAQQHISR